MLSRINFTLTQLEYAIAVHRYGHFAKAADSCHVTQPTLSMQLHKLEETLGVVLFDRSKKPILLTAAGEKLLPQMQVLLFEAKRMTEMIHTETTGELTGRLKLGVIPTIAPYVLPQILQNIEKAFPDLELVISELQTEKIVSQLEADQLDVGLLAIPLGINNLQERPLFYDPFYVLCNSKHELSELKRIKPNVLKYPDIWLLEEGHCLRNQILDICTLKKKQERKSAYTFESGSIETLKNLVNDYGGYTLIPSMAIDSFGSKSKLIPFEKPAPAREVGLIYRRKHYKASLIDALSSTIIKNLPHGSRNLKEKDIDLLPVESD